MKGRPVRQGMKRPKDQCLNGFSDPIPQDTKRDVPAQNGFPNSITWPTEP